MTCGSAPRRTAASRIAAKSSIAGKPLDKEIKDKKKQQMISYEKSCITTWLGKKGNSLLGIVFCCQFNICWTCLFSIEILLQWRTVDSSKIRRQKGNCAKR